MEKRSRITSDIVAAIGAVLLLIAALTFGLALPGSGAARKASASASRLGAPLAALPLPPQPQAQISVAVSPASYGLTISQSIMLVATVANDSTNQGVTWSVSGSGCSGAACGTMSLATSTSVQYTAPTTGGVYAVTATSVADITRSATATLGVTDLSGVLTYRNDGTRTSINRKEYLLTPSNVNTSSFGKLFSCAVDGSVYAQPLWVANVAIGGGMRNVVIVATMHDSVYAFDADNGSGTTCTRYWKASMLTSAYGAGAGATPVPPADTGETGDIPTEIGITSTPVIDPATNHLFVVSKTKENGQYFQRLHRLSLFDGTETAGAPQVISASVTGSGNGSSNNILPYIPLHQNQRPGLALVNGIVYITSGSHGDISPWHGWIIGYNASTLALASAFCTTPNTDAGGIWMSGSAPVFDSSNNLFVISSNGTYDGSTEFGDSFLKLSTSSGLTLSDWFTPDDQASLSANNTDLGQGGAVTLLDSVSGPIPHLIIGGGKEGVLYLLNRDNMGHFHSADNKQAVQSWSLGNMIAASGTFWQNTFYIGAANSPLQAYAFNTTTGLFNTLPTSQSNALIAFPGLTPAITASGTSNAIIWTVDSSKSGTNGAATGPAVLYAFDPNNLANEFWDSTQASGNRDQAGNAVKFVVPTVANGKVYVGAVGVLNVYGLLSRAPSVAVPTFSPGPGTYATAQNVTLSDTTPGATIYYTLDGSAPTTTSSVYLAPINVVSNTTINAIAAVSGLNNSPIASGDYIIQTQGTGIISFVQASSLTPQSSQTTVSVTYTAAQAAGDLNLVVVGWNDVSRSVSSVTDSKGNTYTPAVGPTLNSAGGLSQTIYYAKNIAAAPASGNIVTVTFNGAAAFPDIRILEYKGAHLNFPVEITAAGTGNSATSSTTALATTNANDLLFAANIVSTGTAGPGAGFTSRIITVPDSDIAEDRLAAAPGSYSATASLTAAGQWIMQMVALLPAGGTPPPDTTPPTAPTNLIGPGPTVQAVQGYINSTFLTTHTTAAFDSTGGDSIVVFASSHAGVTMTPSDNFNNTWISAAGPTNTSIGFDLRSQMWYAKSPTVGPGHTFTLNLSAAESLVISVFVVKGSNASAPIDAISTIGDDVGSQTVNVTSPNITATRADDLLIGFAKSSAGEVFTSGTGFTAQPAASSNFLDAESEMVLPPGIYDSTFTLSTQATWQAAIVAVEPSATASTASEIDLTWTASTDDFGVTGYLVERCQGTGCTNFTQIGSTIGTAFNDTGLAASATYGYRVRATDAAGNLSAYSNTALARTQAQGGPAPTAPTNLAATAGGPVQVNLTWTAATETGGTITNYLVERCAGAGCSNFAQVGTSATTTFNDTGLTGSTSYSYRVRAIDTTNVTGPYSNTATATTGAPTFTAPSNLAATASGNTQVNLTWTAATETGGTISQYLIERCTGAGCSNFAQVGTSATTTFNDPGLLGSTSYSYRVRATDASNNMSGYSNTASATTGAPTFTAPSNLAATASGSTQVNLTWTAATETGGTISQYLVERCTGAGCSNFAQVGTSATTTFNDTGLLAGTSYSYRVRATDASNNLGPYSNSASAMTPANTPTAPTNLTATAAGPVQINLTWTAATETGGTISQYLIERCSGASCSNFVQVGTSAATTFNNTGLSGSTSYSYRVRAMDTTNNTGPYSNTASATTAAPTFTAPSGLTATAAGSTQINLTWTAATETGGTISQYLIERCSGASCSNFAQVGTSATTTFNDTGLLAGTSYSYRVRATDASNNVGPYSSVASATTSSTLPPPITFVQGNSAVPQTPQTTVTVPYSLAQAAGDLNIIVVGWNDSTATVSSITDSSGNLYSQAIAPTVISGTLSQTIYYAKNIVAAGAGANTVTVKFSVAAVFPDIRILEYSGMDTTSPLDVSAAASGNSATSTSASVTTTNANDLIVGANLVATATSGPGASFTSRVITSPDGDIAEDKVVSAVGSYNATAPLTSSGPWIMHMVAFRTPAGTGVSPTAPGNLTATAAGPVQINLTWTASTETGGTIANYLIERCSGASCSNFAQVGTSATTTFNDTGLSGSTSYSYRVRAIDTTNVTGPYSNTASATTAAPTFTAPSGLAATASGPVQINLTWTAATETGGTITQYLIERCTGATCINFVQVGTSATTSFNDTGLLGSTAYSYRVRATDASSNFSAYSNTASATTAAPTFTAPSNLAATASGSTQVNLTWSAATETGGTISQYLIERCQGSGCSSFAQVATSVTTTFNNTGLLAGTSYSYRVRATDAANNVSTYSNVAGATTSSTPPPPITFVQSNSATPQSSQTSVSVTYLAAQAAGDLNIIVVGWNDSTRLVNSVTDSRGNVYTLAVGPTVNAAGGLSQSIYYAKNIAAATAGGNKVTVTFNGAAAFPDIRILEYSGMDTTSPLDVSAAASGNSATSTSASVTTTNANDLIVGANLVATATSGPGASFTSRVITSPDGDIAEDKVVSAVGSYNATAPLTSSGPWIMHMVAFKGHP